MHSQSTQVMLLPGVVVAQLLLGLEVQKAVTVLVDTTYTCCVAVVVVGQLRGVRTDVLQTGSSLEFQSLVQLELQTPGSSHLVSDRFLLVVEQGTGRVDTATETTTATLAHTIVIRVVAGLGVVADRAIGIVQEHGVDRRYTVDVSKTVVHVTALSRVVERRIGVRYLNLTFQPFLCLEVDFGVGGYTVEIRTDIVTFVLQVSKRCIVLRTRRTARKAQVGLCLLSHTEDVFRPGRHILVLVKHIHVITELMGITVDELISLFVPQVVDNRQTFRPEQLLVGGLDTLILVITRDRVVDTHPRHLHILLRIGDNIVQRQQVEVGTIVDIYVNLGFLTGGTFLGVDHDHTVGTTATVQCGGAGILQYIVGSDIVRVDGRHVALVGHTIDDDKRC